MIEMEKIRVAVVGVGQFGRNHCRVVAQSQEAVLAAVVDSDAARAAEMAAQYGCPGLTDCRELSGQADAAIVAVPTTFHTEVGCRLMQDGLDVLVEKPIAPDEESAARLTATAAATGRILQVGHLERFNPAILALEKRVTLPLFFEIHRMSVFSPRSLDIDVVLDLMIHDIDIVLALVGAQPAEIRAAGISVLSGTVDIANVRLQFPSGCVANLTASRVSTEKVRKLRLFQPRQYLSLDYSRQDMFIISVNEKRQVTPEPVFVTKSEPLQNQLDAFLKNVRNREIPRTSGERARQTLQVALAILDKIKEHSELVSRSLVAGWQP
jgi:predicted dehydrogenase